MGWPRRSIRQPRPRPSKARDSEPFSVLGNTAAQGRHPLSPPPRKRAGCRLTGRPSRAACFAPGQRHEPSSTALGVAVPCPHSHASATLTKPYVIAAMIAPSPGSARFELRQDIALHRQRYLSNGKPCRPDRLGSSSGYGNLDDRAHADLRPWKGEGDRALKIPLALGRAIPQPISGPYKGGSNQALEPGLSADFMRGNAGDNLPAHETIV